MIHLSISTFPVWIHCGFCLKYLHKDLSDLGAVSYMRNDFLLFRFDPYFGMRKADAVNDFDNVGKLFFFQGVSSCWCNILCLRVVLFRVFQINFVFKE